MRKKLKLLKGTLAAPATASAGVTSFVVAGSVIAAGGAVALPFGAVGLGTEFEFLNFFKFCLNFFYFLLNFG